MNSRRLIMLSFGGGSASSPFSDMSSGRQFCRDVPEAAVSRCSNRRAEDLLDHLVGAGKQRGRNAQTEGLGGLEVDCQLVLRRRLHRQVRWLLALENAIDIFGRARVVGDKAGGPIGDQSPSGNELSVEVDRRHLVLRRKIED